MVGDQLSLTIAGINPSRSHQRVCELETDQFCFIHRRDRLAVLSVTERDMLSRAAGFMLITLDLSNGASVTNPSRRPFMSRRDMAVTGCVTEPPKACHALSRRVAPSRRSAMMPADDDRAARPIMQDLTTTAAALLVTLVAFPAVAEPASGKELASALDALQLHRMLFFWRYRPHVPRFYALAQRKVATAS